MHVLKSAIPELVLFFDMEWVPDAVAAARLFDLPEETTELDAMQALWQRAPDYRVDDNPRPFLKYMFSRVVSIAFMSRKPVFRDGEAVLDFSLNSLPELPLAEEQAALITPVACFGAPEPRCQRGERVGAPFGPGVETTEA